MKKGHRRSDDVVLLKDLAPRKDVKGGAGKRLFGESFEKKEQPREPTRGQRAGKRRSKD